jgi:hypothetical protein
MLYAFRRLIRHPMQIRPGLNGVADYHDPPSSVRRPYTYE